MLPLTAFLLSTHLLGAAPTSAPTGGSVESAPVPAEAPAAPALPLFGVKLDVGLPDGLGASLCLRPLPWLRLEGGVLENGAAPGFRAGVALLPVRSWVTPVLALEGGYYFAGNANPVVQRVTQSASFQSAFLKDVQYDFANAHVGVELGSYRRFVFFVHAGVSHVDAQDNSFGQGLQQAAGSQWSSGPAKAHVNSISAKLGFILYVG